MWFFSQYFCCWIPLDIAFLKPGSRLEVVKAGIDLFGIREIMSNQSDVSLLPFPLGVGGSHMERFETQDIDWVVQVTESPFGELKE